MADTDGRFVKGRIPWNKGKKCDYLLSNKHSNGQKIGFKHSDKTKQKLRKIHKSNWATGKEKVNSGNFQNGQKPKNYIDGRSKIQKMIRTMREYLTWRSSVFKRDNYYCQNCGEKGYLEAHHIIPFSQILFTFNIKNIDGARKCSSLWDVGNGISYCRKCHILLDKNIGTNIGLILARNP